MSLSLNDCVRVCNYSPYRNKYVGKDGLIERISGSSIGVRLNGYINQNSAYGVFWFKEKDLKIINKKESEYTYMSTIMGDFKVALVQFIDGRNNDPTYEYALFDDYTEGDVCVVMSANHGMGLAVIRKVIDRETATTKKFQREIICKVDMDEYNERKNKREKASKIKAEMEKKVKELQELTLFEMMADKCPELQKLLDEYKEAIK